LSFNRPGDQAQHLIARQMAVHVVEVLEEVDIGHDQRDGSRRKVA
jgi:hypothetical protein